MNILDVFGNGRKAIQGIKERKAMNQKAMNGDFGQKKPTVKVTKQTTTVSVEKPVNARGGSDAGIPKEEKIKAIMEARRNK